MSLFDRYPVGVGALLALLLVGLGVLLLGRCSHRQQVDLGALVDDHAAHRRDVAVFRWSEVRAMTWQRQPIPPTRYTIPAQVIAVVVLIVSTFVDALHWGLAAGIVALFVTIGVRAYNVGVEREP